MKVSHELFMHAQQDEQHCASVNQHDERSRGSIVDVIEDGIEAGVFADVDATRMGRFITDVIHAARERRISLGHEDAPEETRRAIDEFILDSLDTE